MIGIDTNVLVRYFVKDDAKQAEIAGELISGLSARQPGFISHVVLAELAWVLVAVYRFTREELERALRIVLQAEEVQVEAPELAWKSLREFNRGGADFADHLIVSSAAHVGCTRTVTFDKIAAKNGMELLTG